MSVHSYLVMETTELETHQPSRRFIPYLVLLSSLLSFALGAGFNLGIAGALTVAQSQRFEISLERASWSVSVHNVCYLMASTYVSVIIWAKIFLAGNMNISFHTA